MRLVVQDANIIIDLIDCEIFELFFQLGFEVVTTSLVLDEISDPPQKKRCQTVIGKKILHVHEISTLEYLRLQALDLPGLSVTDRSVLHLAQAREASLLTGDGKLRTVAGGVRVNVHGILWIIDQLVEKRLLPIPKAYEKLSALKARNKRLPQSEIEKRLRAWAD